MGNSHDKKRGPSGLHENSTWAGNRGVGRVKYETDRAIKDDAGCCSGKAKLN